MILNDFDYNLPNYLIADRPISPRSSSRLLIAKKLESFFDSKVSNLPNILNANDLLVFNDTRVLQSRLFGFRVRESSKAIINVTLLSENEDNTWLALIKPLRKIKVGETIKFNEFFSATLIEKRDGQGVLSFNLTKSSLRSALLEFGSMPLPPYIESQRKADERDKVDYQSIFARNDGAVAAPTASLHFDSELISRLQKKGVQSAFVTLHVGAGTFLPVKVTDIKNHKMHSEWGEVTETTLAKIAKTKARGGRVIPVGTTALRIIETAFLKGGVITPWSGMTDIFIYPGFKFSVSDGLITNFHLPKSTLMMLVSAFIGSQRTRNLYSHAIKNKYRFFSYGDACLLLR